MVLVFYLLIILDKNGIVTNIELYVPDIIPINRGKAKSVRVPDKPIILPRNNIEAIGTADVIDVLILLIKISLNVLFKVLIDKLLSLFIL